MADEKFEQRAVAVKLSKEELAARSKELADITLKQVDLEYEKKSAAAAIKEEIERAKRRPNELSGIVKYGEEVRKVDCMWVPDVTRMRMNLVREDNGGIVESREMSDKERQTELSGVR